MEKTCSKCGVMKLLSTGFYKESRKRDGYQSQCKECHLAHVNLANQKRRKTPKKITVKSKPGFRICTTCKEEKPETAENFYFRADTEKFRAKCIACHKKKANPNFIKAKARKEPKNKLKNMHLFDEKGADCAKRSTCLMTWDGYLCTPCKNCKDFVKKDYSMADHLSARGNSSENFTYTRRELF